MKPSTLRFAAYLLSVLLIIGVAACNGNHGAVQPPQPQTYQLRRPGAEAPAPLASATPCSGPLVSASTGGSIAVTDPRVSKTYTFKIPPLALSANSKVSIVYIPKASLPAPLIDEVAPDFTRGAGNTYVSAWSIAICTATLRLGSAIEIDGFNPGAVNGTTYNVAINASSTWSDVGTALVTTTGTIGGFETRLQTQLEPGVSKSGKYLIYKPASGTNVEVSNLGIVLAGDDTANDPGLPPPTPNPNVHGVNLIHLEDTKGNALATPVLKLMQMSDAADTDGLTLTPDASQGAVVTGFNKVRFFSNAQTGSPVVSSKELDISSYGGDGDAIADLPNGDEAVVSGDGATKLLILSGILSGAPVEADTVTLPSNRDALVMSTDGKVLLGRGASGLTVWKVNSVAAHAGSLGGTVRHTYTLEKDFTTAGYPAGSHFQDGRGGMAICPTDSTRGIVLNAPASDDISLITGLPSAPKISSVAHIGMSSVTQLSFDPAIASQLNKMDRESIVVSGGNAMGAVSITPGCKFAVIGTGNISGLTLTGFGLIVVTGISTGTLSQVGTNFNPTITDMDHHSVTLGAIGTLAITLDAKYIGAFRVNPNHAGYDFSLAQLYDRGEFFTIAIDSTGHLSVKGQLNNVAIPLNDQAVAH
jgi:hypothetical protein